MHGNNNPYSLSQVKKSLVHFLFGKGSSAIIGISLLLLTVRALPAEAYGLYIALLAAFEIIQLTSNFGLFSAAYRYVPQLRSQNRGKDLRELVYWLAALRILTLVASVAIVLIYVNQLTIAFNFTGFEEIIFIYSFVVIFEGFSRYLDILFDSLLQQKYSQLTIFFRNGMRLIGLVGFIFATNWDVSITDWVYIELFSSLVGAILASVLLVTHIVSLQKYSTTEIYPKIHIRRYLGFIGPSYMSQVVGVMYGSETTKIILTKVSDALQVGAFGFAASLSGMLQRYLPVFLLLGLVRPLFVSVNTSDDRVFQLNELANLVLKLNIFVLFPAIAYVLVSGEKLAHLLSGGKFSNSANYIAVFIVLLVFQTWHAVLGLVTLAVEDGLSGLHGTLLGLIGLGIGLLLLPDFGPMSLCAGLILSEIIWCLYVVQALSRKGIPINHHWRSIVKMIAFSAIGYIAASFINAIELVYKYSTILDAFIISVIFLGLCYRYKPFSSRESSIVNKILPWPVFVW